LNGLPMHPSMRKRIDRYLEAASEPHIG